MKIVIFGEIREVEVCPGCLNQPMEYITCQICGNSPKGKNMPEQCFIDILVLRRKEKKLSQSDLAEKTGVSRNYISQIERGNIENVSYRVFFDICKALELSFFLGVKKYENFRDFARPTPVAGDGAKCFVCGQPCGGGALCDTCDTSKTPRA